MSIFLDYNYINCTMQKRDAFQYSSVFGEKDSGDIFVGDDLIQESLQVLVEGCQSSVNLGDGKFSIGKAAGKTMYSEFEVK